ncbi:unnamed protein product [Closterium sp. NIES-53]
MSGSPRSNNGSSVTSPSRPTASPAADNSHLQQQQQQQHQYQQPMYGMPLSSQPVYTTTAAASSTAAAATAARAASTAAAAVPGPTNQPGQQSNFVSTGPYQYQVEEDFSLHLNEVLMVPRLGFNLMSSAQLMKNGITLLGEPGKFTLKYGDKKLGTAVEQNGVFVLNFIPERTTADSDNILSLGPWEHRDDIDYTDDTVPREGVVPTSSTTAAAVMLTFDDQGLNDVENSREYMAAVTGWGTPSNMPPGDGTWGADEPDETTWGETPAESNARLLAEAEQRVAEMEVLDSGQLVGIEPIPADGFNGERYVITFTDASTRYVWTGNMTNRFLAFTAFRTWLPLAERESDTKLKAFQCDGAGEYRSTEFTIYLQERGIRRLFSLPHAHQQSGVAERLNRTLQEKMRALLAQAQLGPLYWPFAMDHATLLHNLLSSSALPNNASPHLLWTGKLGTTKLLRVFGCIVQYRPPTAPLGKFDQRAKWGLHLGIEKQYSAWRIMDHRSRLLVPARDCIFYENLTLPVFEQHLASQQNPATLFHGVRSFANADVAFATSEEPDSDGAREAAPDPPVPVTSSGIPEFIPLADATPEDVREVHHTYLVDEQRQPMPVVSDNSIRVNLDEIGGASGDQNDSVNFAVRQIDVSNAFLYADVDAEIYVEYPHTYLTNPPSVCKLKKSLYGIKQAPRLWQQHLNKKLTEVGFRQLPHDPGMYRLDDKGSYALLVAYVDDILYVSSSTSLGDRIEAELKKSLDLTISTEVTQFLGLNVSRTSSAIHLTASKYAESLAKRFNISTDFIATPYRSTLTGHVPNLKNLSTAGLQLYQQQLGCLLFAAVTCRPDLAYVASHLAQFLRCPKEEHALDLQRALRYFVSTPTLGLIFNAGKPTDKMYLSGYVDADHAGDTSDRRSRTGYIFRLEPIGPISWNSSKQELVSLSSAEAEFIAACAATREGLYLQELLDEAKFVTPNQFTLQCDNQSAITIANKPGFVNRTKHISLRYFFVKDAIDKGRMRLVYCPTSDMVADSLTKKLTRQKFHHCNQLSGISESTG